MNTNEATTVITFPSGQRRGASIGTRWTDEHVERRDTTTGQYESLNPHHDWDGEFLQDCLTAPKRRNPDYGPLWWAAVSLIALASVGLIAGSL